MNVGSAPLPEASGPGEEVCASVSRRSVYQTSESSSTHGRRSSRSRRYRRASGEASVARRRPRRTGGGVQAPYSTHVCRFPPYCPPSAAMLDPFPNARINSLCVVGLSTIVTAHRTGVRLYRERRLPGLAASAVQHASAQTSALSTGASRCPSNATEPAASPAAMPQGTCPATGVFELIETRHAFQVRDSYLCAAMQPVLVDGAVYLSKWSRYFCVASGSDRVVHSVSVMSSGAHFCLNHTRHQTNKVVCMQCTQLALESYQPLSLSPVVVSVDEVGAIVFFDVEREAAVVLEKAPLWYRQTDVRPREEATPADSRGLANYSGERAARADKQHGQVPLQQQSLTPEEEDHVLSTMEKSAMSERTLYHLEHGIATRVALIGPCLELCNHCHNAFSRSTLPSRGYKLVSLYLCSRARDVPDEATSPEEVRGSRAAEINAVLLRVLWGPRRAFVLEEVRLLHEVVPADVCDAGIAMNARPYQVGIPVTLLLARPGLELWRLCGCTGDLIETRRLYAANGDGGPGDRRCASEFFLHWVPLGRHRLVVEQRVDSEEERSWFCTAAVTSNDAVLLLGSAPMPVGRNPVEVAGVDAASHSGDPGAVATKTEPAAEAFKDVDLEAWLDDVNAASRSSSSPAAEGGPTAAATAEAAELSAGTSAARGGNGDSNGVCGTRRPVTYPYTVLMELYAPQRSSGSGSTPDSTAPVSAAVLSVLPDWTANRLLLFIADNEVLLSVPLPFLDCVGTLNDAKQQDADSREGCRAATGVAAVTNAVDRTLSSHAVAQTDHAAPEEVGDGGLSQYLREATSKAVATASGEWLSSMQRWTPTVSPYFSHFEPAGGTANEVAPLHHQPPEEALAPSADGSTRAPLSDAATATSAAASGGRRDSYRLFSLTRPLVAALFHLSGGDEAPALPTTAKAPLTEGVASLASDAKAVGVALSVPPVQQPSTGAIGSPTPCLFPLAASVVGQRSGTWRHGPRRGSSRESGRADSSRHRRTRRSPRMSTEAPASSAAAAHTVTIEDGAAAQASYISTQMALLREQAETRSGSRASENGSNAGESHSAQEPASTVSEWQYALRHVAEVGEPLGRNALLYAWEDGHNELYIRFTVEQDNLRQREIAAEGGTHSGASSPERESGGVSPDAAKRSLRPARPSLALGRPADAADGVHSIGFLSQYSAIVHGRLASGAHDGRRFNFSGFFRTLQVPQHVLDAQERDKCWLELEDLRLRQARDLVGLQPYDVVTIYQNQERAASKGAEWRLHATFPYDDAEDGHAVDLQQLNRDASGDAAVSAAPEWRWADASEVKAWAEDHHLARSPTSRVKSLLKELKDWEVGPWMYATRWPSREEEVRGSHGFQWSPSESSEHICRRRRLTRLRINIAELKRQAELMASHEHELEVLRETLGL
ncbi:hypothetical protein LSCM1_01341 [Leishmania martiniquensis]|uniref:Uncharacterized protein n=1 Tax=Leishmania martiniquensis TaxID=1580590 RepID=A0A836H726_9TRYP|nr:hypothetical protein LSCM1_01341 [Leishmania martiniquensis]